VKVYPIACSNFVKNQPYRIGMGTLSSRRA
jgi:hypothetical protein